jgi:hypothetical protein
MIRNLGLLLLAVVASMLLLPLIFIRNLLYKICDTKSLSKYIFAIAHGIDVMAASTLYGTTYKTISGVTGRKAWKEREVNLSSSYIYPFEKLINWLFNDPLHCYKAHKAEYPEEFTQ